MSAEVNKEIQLEIGHVLFIDIVGYSKLLITEQSEQLQTLKQIVRGTEQFRAAEAEGKLLRLPTNCKATVLRLVPPMMISSPYGKMPTSKFLSLSKPRRSTRNFSDAVAL